MHFEASDFVPNDVTLSLLQAFLLLLTALVTLITTVKKSPAALQVDATLQKKPSRCE
jgi:hypothetical protein